jgi:hypothetical protein
MFLGQVHTAADIDKSLNTLIKVTSTNIELPAWDKLPSPLRSLTLDNLNTTIINSFKNTYKMIGKYPDSVVLLWKPK